MQAEGANLVDMRHLASFTLPSDPAAVREGLQRALEEAPLSLLSVEDRSTAEIVLAEVLNNVVEHAYAAGSGPIRLLLRLTDGGLACRIEDEGAAMPGGEPPAGIPPDPQMLPEGGFGWHLIRTLCSDLSYLRQGTTNRLDFLLPAEQSGK